MNIAVALTVLGLGLGFLLCAVYLGLAAAGAWVVVPLELLGAVLTVVGVVALLATLRPPVR